MFQVVGGAKKSPHKKLDYDGNKYPREKLKGQTDGIQYRHQSEGIEEFNSDPSRSKSSNRDNKYLSSDQILLQG